MDAAILSSQTSDAINPQLDEQLKKSLTLSKFEPTPYITISDATEYLFGLRIHQVHITFRNTFSFIISGLFLSVLGKGNGLPVDFTWVPINSRNL